MSLHSLANPKNAIILERVSVFRVIMNDSNPKQSGRSNSNMESRTQNYINLKQNVYIIKSTVTIEPRVFLLSLHYFCHSLHTLFDNNKKNN